MDSIPFTLDPGASGGEFGIQPSHLSVHDPRDILKYSLKLNSLRDFALCLVSF
jgi:hypothetical protein